MKPYVNSNLPKLPISSFSLIMNLASSVHGLISRSTEEYAHALITAFLSFFFFLHSHPTNRSPVLLGSGALCLEPVRHRQEAVAHRHRDQSHDLRPLPDPSEAEHRRAQGKRSDPVLSVCLWIPANAFSKAWFLTARQISFHPDAWGPNSSKVPLRAELFSSLTVLGFTHHAVSDEDRTQSLYRDFCQQQTMSFSSVSKSFKIPSSIWLYRAQEELQF